MRRRIDMSQIAYFVRHGQTDWNAEGRLQGQADTDLNALGRSQADRNGRRLAELISRPDMFDFVSSPLRRTRETMERLRVAMGLEASGYRIDPRLKEIHFGDWQGSTYAELELARPGMTNRREQRKWHFLPPGEGAESYHMLMERIRPCLDAFERDTICVTHGGVIRSVFRLAGSMSEQDAAALSVPQDRVLRWAQGTLEWL